MLFSDCVKWDQSAKECEKNQKAKTKPVLTQINRGMKSSPLILAMEGFALLVFETISKHREMPIESKTVIVNMLIAEMTICNFEHKMPTNTYINILVGGAAAAVAAGLLKRLFQMMQPGR